MEHANVATEVTIHHEPSASTKRIWKVFWILLIITMIELGLGLSLTLFPSLCTWVTRFGT